jgi:hypothetical protein
LIPNPFQLKKEYFFEVIGVPLTGQGFRKKKSLKVVYKERKENLKLKEATEARNVKKKRQEMKEIRKRKGSRELTGLFLEN